MNPFVLSCCSTADLSKEHLDRRDIHYVCFHYTLDGVQHMDDLGVSMPLNAFYTALANGSVATTSQVNLSEYMNYFTGFLEQGLDVLHVCLSSGISGSYNSAMSAAMIAREQFPDRKIYVVDSLGASSGFGLIMETLADLRDGGMNIDGLHDWVEANKLRMHHWFFSTDLSFYVRGGRISRAAGLFGSLLNICPLLNMDNLGRLIPRSKLRGKRKAISEIVERMEQHAENGLNYAGKCFISNSACYDDARQVADLVEQRFPHLNGKVLINDIGTTIGSHTGPGTVALFFWGDERVN